MSRGTLPSLVSISRIGFALLFYVMLEFYPLIPILPLLAVFFLIEISDIVDGYVARKTGSVSDVGKLLDPVCDVTAHFLCLFALYKLYIVPGSVIIIFTLREIWVMFFRSLLAKYKVIFAARWSGKLKTWLYGVAIFFSILLLPQSPFAEFGNTFTKYLIMLYYLAAFFSLLSLLHYVTVGLRTILRQNKE